MPLIFQRNKRSTPWVCTNFSIDIVIYLLKYLLTSNDVFFSTFRVHKLLIACI